MLVELNGKGGTLCSHARTGEIRCPLIVRPTSEDVITGHLFQSLGTINPRWWLPDLLNTGLNSDRFRRRFHRNFRIQLWQNQPRYPRELLPWDEGSTQVDAVISWENPPTTVFVEMKYRSDLSARVSGDDGESGYPSDQLIRNIRVGLHRSGYFRNGEQLFEQTPRDFIVLVVAPTRGHPLVEQYRCPERLRKAIPHLDRLIGLPAVPFVGEVGYADIIRLLRLQRRWLSRPEKSIADTLVEYLDLKLSTRAGPSYDDTFLMPSSPECPVPIEPFQFAERPHCK